MGLTNSSPEELERIVETLTALKALNSPFSKAWLTRLESMVGNQSLAAFLQATPPIAVEAGIAMSGADQQVRTAMLAVYAAFMGAL